MLIKCRLLLLSLLFLAVSIFSCSDAELLEVESWYQREIIGQGNLVSVDAEVYSGYYNWLISLELTTRELEKEVTVYHVGNNLTVSNREGDYSDTKRFVIGRYYVLYRKIENGRIRYHLAER